MNELSVGRVLARRAALSPSGEALIDLRTAERLTFADLDARATGACSLLARIGIEKGDRVGMLLPNGAPFVEILLGIARRGAVAVPLNWRLAAEEIAWIAEDAAISALVFDASLGPLALDAMGTTALAPRLIAVGGLPPGSTNTLAYEIERDAAGHEPEPQAGGDDLLYLMYTSGTTGRPKGVMHTHETALWAVLTIAATLDVRSDDRTLVSLPLFHVGALSSVLSNLYRGSTTVILAKFDPAIAWQTIDEEKISVTSAVPVMLETMLAARPPDARHESLRWCAVGGAPVSPELVRSYASIGIRLVQVYGLTESGGPGTAMPSGDALRKAGSAGKAYLHTSVRILTADGAEAGPGEVGEVHISGRHLMRGYWKRPLETAAALRDGWLSTGDAAIVDAEGFLYLKDRLKDMIISGGENVYPAEVEQAIAAHPDVADVAVVGRRSERWGEEPVAFIVASNQRLEPQNVVEFCRGRLARYKVPKSVVFVSELPRNASGKILKHVLRSRLNEE